MGGRPKGSDGLDDQERIFVNEYCIDLDVQRAATAAKYSKSVSESKAYKWLSPTSPDFKPHVHKAIQDRMKIRAISAGITQDMVVQELAKIGFLNMADYITGEGKERTIDLEKLTRDQAAAISEITTDVIEGKGEDADRVKRIKLKLGDKKGALDSLGRHLGMFIDKTEHTGAVTVVVNKPK